MSKVRLLSVKYATGLQVILIILLIIAHLIGLYILHTKGVYISKFDLDYEHNIPTYYQVLALCFSSYLISIIALSTKQTDGKFFVHWLVLAIIFCFLGFDELLLIHDRLSEPLRNSFDLRGSLYATAKRFPIKRQYNTI